MSRKYQQGFHKRHRKNAYHYYGKHSQEFTHNAGSISQRQKRKHRRQNSQYNRHAHFSYAFYGGFGPVHPRLPVRKNIFTDYNRIINHKTK